MYETRDFFNERASAWDKVSAHDPEKLCIMLILSDIAPESIILDVGCGTGVLEPYLLAYSPAKVLAIDFAENMITQARAKLSDPAVEFRCCDLFQLREFTCDHCFFVSAFPHFPDPEKALRHTVSLLNPGGRLTISNIQGKYCGQGSDIFNPMLPAQGLINLLRPYFRLDVLIDNRAMFLVSGTKLSEPRH